MDINEVTLIGRLGKDPELKYTPAGKPVCELSVATGKQWKDQQGQKQERTEWHRVKVWGPAAEHCANYLSKGSRVMVRGEIQTRSWEDQEGKKRYVTEVVVQGFTSYVHFMDTKPQQNQGQDQGYQGGQQQRQQPPQQRQQQSQGRSSPQGYDSDNLPPEGHGYDDVPF